MITGMRPIGRKCWGFVEYPQLITPYVTNDFPSGILLEKNLRRSLAWSKSQREIATLMSASYPVTTVDEWRKMRDEFDLDQSKPNPYEEVDNRAFFFQQTPLTTDQIPDVTMAQLKLQLLQEEAKELTERGPMYKVSPGAFFRKALDIEERRCVSVSLLYLSMCS